MTGSLCHFYRLQDFRRSGRLHYHNKFLEWSYFLSSILILQFLKFMFGISQTCWNYTLNRYGQLSPFIIELKNQRILYHMSYKSADPLKGLNPFLADTSSVSYCNHYNDFSSLAYFSHLVSHLYLVSRQSPL